MRGWLFPEQPVDIGTTGDTDALATGAVISAVDYSNPAAPTITIGRARDRHHGRHALLLHPQPELGDGAEPGAERPAPDHRRGRARRPEPGDGRPGVLARRVPRHDHDGVPLDLPLNLQRYVLQNSNQPGTAVWTGYRQQANFYSLLQSQVQFTGDRTSPPATSTSRSGTA